MEWFPLFPFVLPDNYYSSRRNEASRRRPTMFLIVILVVVVVVIRMLYFIFLFLLLSPYSSSSSRSCTASTATLCLLLLLFYCTYSVAHNYLLFTFSLTLDCIKNEMWRRIGQREAKGGKAKQPSPTLLNFFAFLCE